MHSQIPSSCTAPKIHSFFVQQDSKEIRSKQKGFGLSTKGLPGVDAGLSGTGSFNSSSERGNFVSVVEQSGINAGASGFNINVDGATNLVGGVISSTADPALNQLTTGTLTASDLQNRESYKANSIGLSGSISGVGGKDSSGNKTNTDFSAGTPIVLGASGGQSGVTQSAIAPGTINITSGDAASQNVAATISRDTSTANAGALIQEFDAARRAEIQEGFAVTTALIQQTSQFFANRAETEKAKREDADRKEAAAISAGAVQLEEDGRPHRDGNGNLVAIDPNNADLVNAANAARNDANAYRETYGANSPARIIATALSGAAASNVAGSLGDLIQAAAVNVLQSYTANEIKHIADSLAERDGENIIETPESETARALLQGLAGCAGAAAGGSADCTSAALGASASVVINLLLNSIEKDFQEARDQEIEYDENGNPVNPLSLEQQQERSDLVASIIGGISSIVGLDAAAAVTAGQIETENNQNAPGTQGLGNAQFDPNCGGEGQQQCGLPYNLFKDVEEGFVLNGKALTKEEAAFYRDQYQKAFDILYSRGIVPTQEQVAFVLEAVIGGGLIPERVNGFIEAFGGISGLSDRIKQTGATASELAQKYIVYENIKKLAFEQIDLGELNRYANDPEAFARLSQTDPEYATLIQLASAYVTESTTSAILNGNGSFGDRLEILNREYQLGTRTFGLIQGVGSGLGMIGAGAGTVVSGGSCPVTGGAGCAAAVGLGILTLVEADQAAAGFRALFSGKTTNSLLASGVNALSGLDADRVDLVIGLGAGAAGIVSGAHAITATDRAIVSTFDNATVYGELGQVSSDVIKHNLPLLRLQYLEEFSNLDVTYKALVKSGASDEEIARALSAARRELSTKYKDLTPPEVLEVIYARNIKLYGDKLGPTVDWFRANGQSWEEIIEKSLKSGGKDLGY